MKDNRVLRQIVIATVLFLGVLWSFGSAAQKGTVYPLSLIHISEPTRPSP